jgi:hypothetical protein
VVERATKRLGLVAIFVQPLIDECAMTTSRPHTWCDEANRLIVVQCINAQAGLSGDLLYLHAYDSPFQSPFQLLLDLGHLFSGQRAKLHRPRLFFLPPASGILSIHR